MARPPRSRVAISSLCAVAALSLAACAKVPPRPDAGAPPERVAAKALPVESAARPVYDSRFRIAGKAVETVVQDKDVKRVLTTVQLEAGSSFPIATNSPAFVSADRSRVLVAGPPEDALTFRSGGKALLYDGQGRLLRELQTLGDSWMAPPPAVAVEPDGGVWIASRGTLTRYDRDGAIRWSRPGPLVVQDLALSPSGRRAALATNPLMGKPAPAVLLLDAETGKTLAEGSPTELVDALSFAGEESLLAVRTGQWMLLRPEKASLALVRSGALGGRLFGAHALCGSGKGWLAAALSAPPELVVRVIEVETGKTLLDRRFPSKEESGSWRPVDCEAAAVQAFVGGKQESFPVP